MVGSYEQPLARPRALRGRRPAAPRKQAELRSNMPLRRRSRERGEGGDKLRAGLDNANTGAHDLQSAGGRAGSTQVHTVAGILAEIIAVDLSHGFLCSSLRSSIHV